MSRTIYDKMGELLNDSLKKGKVNFVSRKKIDEEKERLEKEKNERLQKEKNQKKIKEEEIRKQKIKEEKLNKEQKVNYEKENYIYKNIQISPQLERAYRLLGLEKNASQEEIKKAYKEKLKYYHPDRYQGNAILTKVATDKTRQVVEAYNLIVENINSKVF